MAKQPPAKNSLPSPFIPPKIKDRYAVLVIAGAVLIFFRNILLQRAFFWEDFLYYFYPVRNFAAVSLAQGELPLWNPYTFNGMPFQADIQTALFYLPNLLLTFFVSSGRLHFFWVELFIILHYIVAGVTMYYCAKSFGVQRPFALFSGLGYALSGFMIAHAIHQVVICQVAWLPLIVLFFRKALSEKSIMFMLAAGLVLGHAVLAGFPQLTLYIFFFLFLFSLFEFTISSKQHGLASSLSIIPLAAGTVIVAVALTAIQLLPTLELSQLSQRAEISYEKSLVGSLSWNQLITLAIPKFFGASGAEGSNYWGAGGYYDYWETCTYIGIAALVSMVLAASLSRRNRYIAFFAGISFFSLLYALGDSFLFHKFFFYIVPGFDKFRNPARMALLFTFSGAVLSGFGLQHLFEMINSDKQKLRKALFITAAGGIVLWILVQAGMFQPAAAPQRYNDVHAIATGEATTTLVLVIIFCGVLFLMMKGSISPTAAFIAVLLTQFIDMNVFGFNQNNAPLSPNEYYARTARLVSVLQEEGKREFFRVNARQGRGGQLILDRNQGMTDRIFLVEGYTPLVLQRLDPPAKDWGHVCDLLNAKYRLAVDEQSHSMSLLTATTYLPRAFVLYDVKVFKEESSVESFMKSDAFDPRRTVVLEENPELPLGDTAHTKEGEVTIISYTLNTISINISTPKNGVLLLSEIYYPGWHSYIDGVSQRVYRANWNLRAIPVPAGSHHVDVRFEPESFQHGVWITVITLGLSGGGIAISLSTQRRNKKFTTRSDQATL